MLSGDHMKGASDANMPLVGVGLLYQKGYHQQRLNPDGWQQELYPVNDFYSMPVKPVLNADGSELKVSVELPHFTIWIKVWCADVGRVKLYLLDTNIPDNAGEDVRNITENLYGGDSHNAHPAGDCPRDWRVAGVESSWLPADGLPYERRPRGLFWRSNASAI